MSIIPMVVTQTPGGSERVSDIYSMLLQNRIIMLTTQFEDSMASNITSQLLYLASLSDEPISMYINSPGGVVTSALTILNTMNLIKAPVYTYVIGQAASCGSLIAQAGEAGHRYILPYGRHMIHRVSSGTVGTSGSVHVQELQFEDEKRRYEESQKVNKILTQIYVDNNSKGKTFEEMHETMKFDTYMDAQESIDFGLADKIITSI